MDVQDDLSLFWSHRSYCRFCHALVHILSDTSMKTYIVVFIRQGCGNIILLLVHGQVNGPNSLIQPIIYLSENWHFFLFLEENIYCGYSLEVPQWRSSNEYHSICFLGEISKIHISRSIYSLSESYKILVLGQVNWNFIFVFREMGQAGQFGHDISTALH